AVPVPLRDRVLARERWIADDYVEPRRIPPEYFGELDLPVEGRDSLRASFQLLFRSCGPQRHVAAQVLRHLRKQIVSPRLPPAVVVRGEERRHHHVAREANQAEALVGYSELLRLEQRRHELAAFENVLPSSRGGRDSLNQFLLAGEHLPHALLP